MTEVATIDPTTRIMELREQMLSRSGELRASLGDDIPVEVFVRALMTSLQLNPDLLACRFKSIWIECMRACRDQLLPDGIEAALVPYKDNCKYIPMYQGLLRRFRRSGQFKWITAGVVRSGEEFSHYIDEYGEHFRHVPGDDDRPIDKAYSIAITRDGATFVAVLSAAELDKIRRFSKATRDDAPWNQWPEEMAKKSAIRRLSKLLPSVRDLMPADDAPPIAPSAPTPIEAPPRVRTIKGTLDELRPRDDGSSRADAGGGTAAETRPPASDPAAESGGEAEGGDPLRTAYARGKDWRTRGNGRRGLPGEYRAAERQREALAWQAGFDGQDMPTWEAP